MNLRNIDINLSLNEAQIISVYVALDSEFKF